MAGKLVGHIALITGGGQGVGQGIAYALAAEGAAVAVAGRSLSKLDVTVAEITRRGGRGFAYACDIKQAEALEGLVAAVVGHFGGLSILVNNAQEVPLGGLLQVSDAAFTAGWESGPLASFRLMKLCHPPLKASGRGRIINLASPAAMRWDASGYGAYGAVKEATRQLTRAAACEWARDGIRSNAILPLGDSPAMACWTAARPDEAAAFTATVPMQRVGDCEQDIGRFVATLCSEDCRYINGQSIAVDGRPTSARQLLPVAMAVVDPFAPWPLGPITLRNRFIKAATNEGMARGGRATPLLIEHHRAIAAGGAALTTLAYCAVSPDGRTFEQQILLNAEARPSLKLLTDAVHRAGGKASAQITHGGAFSFLKQLESGRPRSASSGFNPPGVLVGRWRKQAMTEAELAATAEHFAEAARQAEQAGFDAVEIHMGHGYLLSQFISPRYNRRRDAWGGDATARAAFPALVLRRVLDAVGKRLAVVCKISVDEGFAGGGTVADALAIGRVLQASGAHLLVLSAGMNVEAPWAIFGSPLPNTATGPVDSRFARAAAKLMLLAAPRTAFKPLYLLEHSRQLRAGLQMPLAYLGGATSLADVQSLLDEGFDAVAMGRALLHEPNLVRQFATGAAQRSGCTACNLCIAEMYQPGGTRCVLRPANDASRNCAPAT